MWKGFSFFSESFSARRLRKQLQSAPIPPLVPKTRGVKDPISTSSTLCWYFRYFSSSCSLKIVDVSFPWLHLELTCVTLTSKNAVTPRDQKPPALKSSLASGLVTAVLRLNRSLSRGCSCGSTSTLVQTLPISEVCSGGSRGRARGPRPPLIFRRKWGPEGRKHFFFLGRPPPPPYLKVWMTAPPLIWRSGSATGMYVANTIVFLCHEPSLFV